MNKTHDELVTLFADGNIVKYQIQERLGTPFYNPHKVCPDLTWPFVGFGEGECASTGALRISTLGMRILLGGGDKGQI